MKRPSSAAGKILKIVGRSRASVAAIAGIADFRLIEGVNVDARHALRSSVWSLYCLDLAGRRAIFVRTRSRDVYHAVFFYQAQYEAAEDLLAIPYDTLHELAEEITVDPSRLALIYSTGRCGSTLAIRALRCATDVVAISEPDVFTQLVAFDVSDDGAKSELRDIVKSCVKILYFCAMPEKRRTVCAIKVRGSVIGLSGLLFEI